MTKSIKKDKMEIPISSNGRLALKLTRSANSTEHSNLWSQAVRRFAMNLSALGLGLLFGSVALAAEVFTSYEAFYQQISGSLFKDALQPDKENERYSLKGEHGFCGEGDACQDFRGQLGAKKLTATTSASYAMVAVNGRLFRFTDARALEDSYKAPTDIPLGSMSAYTAPKNGKRPDLVCIEGYYMGSGRFRKSEVFLLIDPMASNGKGQFFHLPGLHSACAAVTEEPDGSIGFPLNSYLPEGDATQSEGLLMKVFSIRKGHLHSLEKELLVHFVEKANPWKFYVAL